MESFQLDSRHQPRPERGMSGLSRVRVRLRSSPKQVWGGGVWRGEGFSESFESVSCGKHHYSAEGLRSTVSRPCSMGCWPLVLVATLGVLFLNQFGRCGHSHVNSGNTPQDNTLFRRHVRIVLHRFGTDLVTSVFPGKMDFLGNCT